MKTKIQGKTISQLTEKAEIENDDAFILQDGQETKHAKASALKSYVKPDLSGYATKDEVNGKVSGTGVTKIQVVTELPESPDANTLHIVTAAEETA